MQKVYYRFFTKDRDREKKMKESDVTGPFQGIVFKRHILNCYLLPINSQLNFICVIMQQIALSSQLNVLLLHMFLVSECFLNVLY